jgi:hypothetical protein
MELVPKEVTQVEPTLINQVEKLMTQQVALENSFNITSNNLFGVGPYDHPAEISVGPDVSARLKLLIERNEELISNFRALGTGVGGDDK